MKHDSGQKARDLPVGRQVQGTEISSKVWMATPAVDYDGFTNIYKWIRQSH
ncbi:MAG: hypothetical protein JRG77_08905 [Deltaproteobacteria bacterium]|nr:hypothetical protein [Deltaproteobacteria bacterium]MBW2098894.1 hypothetical protein [Deltaproteobacteria bacterium]